MNKLKSCMICLVTLVLGPHGVDTKKKKDFKEIFVEALGKQAIIYW